MSASDYQKVFKPSSVNQKKAYVNSMEQYSKIHRESIEEPDVFWGKIGRDNFYWKKPFGTVYKGNFDLKSGGIKVEWFLDGKTNICYNAVDRHVLAGHGDQVAFYYEGNDDEERKLTYSELLAEVMKCANMLQGLGLKKGSTVAIYMPMVLECAITMLACTRIGVIHSVVFAGFSPQNLASRMIDCGCQVIICTDGVMRGKKLIDLKKVVNEAVEICEKGQLTVKHCVVHERLGKKMEIKWNHEIDVDFATQMSKAKKKCDVVWMDSEDPLFILYTSGSTGKPKGVIHTTGGYMVWTSTTFRNTFDYHEGDVYWCAADVGWITGHSYIVYGPLLSRATSVFFEGVVVHPTPARGWKIINKYKVNAFYTAPTAIRALKSFGDDWVKKYDISSLRVLGTVGEPIQPEAWEWYHKVVGGGNCTIVDTWWQTETGGHMLSPYPGATPTKPGSATFPVFGVNAALVDVHGKEITSNPAQGYLVIKQSWPGMMRTVWGNHSRYENTYFKRFNGNYFTGDGAKRDKDGYYFITGRVDDVLMVSGHRLGTAEIESAIFGHPQVVGVAVVPVPHDIKGQEIYAYVIVKETDRDSKEKSAALKKDIVNFTGKLFGAIGKPGHIHWATALPKTRSGKIMRRLLKAIATGETDKKKFGDVSTLANPEIIDDLLSLRDQ